MSSADDLGRRAAGGMAWSVMASGGSRVVSLVSIAVLARMLSPGDFGLAAFALVFIAYLEALGDLGTGAALVRWPDRWRDVAQVTFAINVLMGAIWFGLTIFIAPGVADFFGSPDGDAVLRALALTIPLKALGNTHDAIMQRELRFRARAVPEVTLLVAKAAIAIPLAFAGFGVWSLVVGQLAGQALWTILLWIMVPWRPAFALPRADVARAVFGYGRGIVSVNLLAVVVHHADLVVVGRVFGTTVLGLYQMADKLPDVAINLVSRSTSKVLLPVFARLQAGGQALHAMYIASVRYLALLAVPAAVGLILLAEPIVMTVFGADWLPVVPILIALSASAAFRALSAPAGDVLKAIGRPGLLAWLAVARALVLVPALVIATRGGPTAVAVALASVTALGAVLNVGVVCRVAGIQVASVVGALGPGAGASVVLAAALLVVSRAVVGLPPLAQLASGVLVGALTYAGAVRMMSPETWHEVRGALARRLPRGRNGAVLARAEAP